MGVFPRDGVRPLANTGRATNTSLAQIIWVLLQDFLKHEKAHKGFTAIRRADLDPEATGHILDVCFGQASPLDVV